MSLLWIVLNDGRPTEAARALRKKLKYGESHEQIRALVVILLEIRLQKILNDLIDNAGGTFQSRIKYT